MRPKHTRENKGGPSQRRTAPATRQRCERVDWVKETIGLWKHAPYITTKSSRSSESYGRVESRRRAVMRMLHVSV